MKRHLIGLLLFVIGITLVVMNDDKFAIYLIGMALLGAWYGWAFRKEQ